MSINYHLTKSNLSAIAGKYTAKAVSSGTVELADLVEKVSVRKTALGKGDIASVIETLCEVIETELIDGRIVHLGGIVHMGTSIKGIFDTSTSPIDPAVNYPDVTASAGARVKKAILDNAALERIIPLVRNPVIDDFLNVTTGVDNSEIGPSDMAQIKGINLNFDDTDVDQGLFYCDVAGVLADVKVTAIAKAGEKEVTFQTPANITAFSNCYLQLRRRQSPNSELITGKSADLALE